MATVEYYKSALIKKIKTIDDKEVLKYLEIILNDFQEGNSIQTTTNSENKAINKGIDEIKTGDSLSQEEIDSKDMIWLQER